MVGRHILVYLGHFLGTVIILNICFSIIPSNVTDCVFRLVIPLLSVFVTKLTVGISKKIFLSERLKPDRKAVLITGCARGIGKALAKHLHSKGFHVFASCRDENSPGAVDLSTSGSSRLQVFQLDTTSDDSVQNAVKFVKDNLGSSELWAVINNAGIQKGFLLELSSIQDIQDTMEVNAVGPVRVTKAFLPLLRKSRGRVINMASITGRLAVPMTGPYSMSKFALVGFSEYLGYELYSFGVHVISVEPEFFETDMTSEKGINHRLDTMLAGINEDVRNDYGDDFLKGFQSVAGGFFPPEPNLQKVAETVERALILKNPDAVYKVCRDLRVTAFWIVFEVLPAEFKILFARIVSYLSGLSEPGQTKKML